MRVSVELVPREKNSFVKDVETVKDNFPSVDTINVPDIVRYSLRSWEGCALASRFFKYTIPHIRAVDIKENGFLSVKNILEKNNISEVLVISGDTAGSGFGGDKSPALEVISIFKKEMPHVKVYAGIDPYRWSLKNEYVYIQRKIEIGVSGFFTQPFFDLNLMKVYADWLSSIEVFWGVSPVTSERSLQYWSVNNNVVFPKDFSPTLEWNKKFARRVLSFAREMGHNVYFMPIRLNVEEYLRGVL